MNTSKKSFFDSAQKFKPVRISDKRGQIEKIIFWILIVLLILYLAWLIFK